MKYLFTLPILFLFSITYAQDDFVVSVNPLVQGSSSPGSIVFDFNVDVNGSFQYSIIPTSYTTSLGCLSTGGNTITVNEQSETILVGQNSPGTWNCSGGYCFDVTRLNTITLESCTVNVCVDVPMCVLVIKGNWVYLDCGGVASLVNNDDPMAGLDEVVMDESKQQPSVIDLEVAQASRTQESFSVGEVYPNPFSQQVTLPISMAVSSEITLTCYDLYGRNLFEQQMSLDRGEQHVIIDLQHLNYSGYLNLQIWNESTGKSVHRRLIKI